MITAVDTSVLLDIFGADASFGPGSRRAARNCLAEGRLIACEAVWAEVSGFFASAEAANTAMATLGVAFSPLDVDAALAAGGGWKRYRDRGGSRKRVIADFLIGAHALAQADRLLTRDRGLYRTYFESLAILDPSTS